METEAEEPGEPPEVDMETESSEVVMESEASEPGRSCVSSSSFSSLGPPGTLLGLPEPGEQTQSYRG